MYIVGRMVGNIALPYFDKNNYDITYKINYLFFLEIHVKSSGEFKEYMLNKVSQNLYNMFIINLYIPCITLVDILKPQNIYNFQLSSLSKT